MRATPVTPQPIYPRPTFEVPSGDAQTGDGDHGSDDVATPVHDVEDGSFDRSGLLTLHSLAELGRGPEILRSRCEWREKIAHQDQSERELERDTYPVDLVWTVKSKGGRRSGHWGAPPEGGCGSHTFSLLDPAARGIRVDPENVLEPKFGQMARPGPEWAMVLSPVT